MKILYVNSLDKRYGSTYRSRNIVKALIDLHYDVIYVESNLTKKISGQDISINQEDGLLGYVRATYKRARLVLQLDYDVLFLQKFIPLTVPCLVIGKLKRKKCIVDWDDLDFCYQENFVKKIIVFLCEHIFPYFADCITTHSYRLKEYARKRGIKKITIVNQIVDFEGISFTEKEKEELKSSIGALKKKIICFLGTLTMGGAADLDIIIDAIRGLIGQRRDIFFLIIGGGPLEKKISEMLKQNKIDSLSYVTGLLEHGEVEKFLSIADIGLVCMRDNLGNRIRVSFKVLEYLFSGLSVVGCIVGESRDRFSRYCVVTDCASKTLGESLGRLLNNDISRNYIRLSGYSLEDMRQALETAVKFYEKN